MSEINITKDYYIDRCSHFGNIKVFETDKFVIFGGGIIRGATLSKIDVAISLCNEILDEYSITLSDNLVKLLGRNPFEHEVYHIEIDWKDMSVPNMDKEDWLTLINVLNKISDKLNKKINVLFYCYGGHGRTGTALAIVGSLLGLIPKNNCPVRYIRKHYCEAAIESMEQISYIEKITGRKTFTKEVKSWIKY